MKTFKRLFVLAAVAVPLATPLAAQAAVEVTFTTPDKYIDARPRGHAGAKDRDATLVKLRQHLQKQGERFLKPGQDLKIEVLNVDLAGRADWWRSHAHDIRIMRDVDSPSMKMRYMLTESGTVLASGEERISELSYLHGITAIAANNDPLKYDKAMLTDWFRKRFAKFGASAS